MAETAPGKRASAVRFGGTERAPAGAHGGVGTGTGVGDRRATTHWIWRGLLYLADCAGRVAGMIHSDASRARYGAALRSAALNLACAKSASESCALRRPNGSALLG